MFKRLCPNSKQHYIYDMAALDALEDFVRERIEKDRWTHARLSDYLQLAYPGEKGFSVRSVERFCSEKNIHKTSRVQTHVLNQAVMDAITKVKIKQLYCSASVS